MLDVTSQQKITQGCTEAGLGYAQAATAAYTQWASQAMDFWLQAFHGIAAGLDDTAPSKVAVPVKKVEVPFGFSPEDWMPLALFDHRRVDAALSVEPFTNPFGAFMAMFLTVPLKGMPASWPYAQAMINAGVPREVAWPTAEANAAVIGAAEVATKSIQKVLVACQTGSGFVSTLPVSPSKLTSPASALQAMMYAGPWPRVLN